MLPENKTNTNIGVGLGLILQLVGRWVFGRSVVGLVLIIVGAILFIWGCMNYAVGKGHSKWLGLLGLLSCIGLIILVILPDHHKEA
jgi:hypothetical protein